MFGENFCFVDKWENLMMKCRLWFIDNLVVFVFDLFLPMVLVHFRSVWRYVCLSVCPPVRLFFSLSICPSVHLFLPLPQLLLLFLLFFNRFKLNVSLFVDTFLYFCIFMFFSFFLCFCSPIIFNQKALPLYSNPLRPTKNRFRDDSIFQNKKMSFLLRTRFLMFQPV
jgi:hypothetical protein